MNKHAPDGTFIARPLAERMDEKIDKSGECWVWLGARDAAGYGLVWVNEGARSGRAHRYMYERHVGPIPKGLTLDHLCRNKSCVNPAHLEPCTAGENARRAPNAPYWVKARQTHCKNGHEFTEENTMRHHGRRRCKTCSNEYSRQHAKRQRGAA